MKLCRGTGLVLLLLTLGGCDYINPTGKCLIGKTGCALPGRWALESVNSTSQTGSITISEGQFSRDGYLDLPTGFAGGGGVTQPTRLTAPYLGSYLNEPEAPTDFKLGITATLSDGEPRFVDVFGTVELSGDDRFTYTVRTVQARAGSCCLPIPPMPLLKAGTVLVFRRT